MNIVLRLFISLFLFSIHVQASFSQEVKIKNTFKIVGERKVFTSPFSNEKRTVEYNYEVPDHLIISLYGEDGQIAQKTQYLFKGAKFDLTKMPEYLNQKDLTQDGALFVYREDGTIDNEEVFKEGKTIRKTFFYPNGKPQRLISGGETMLDGEYKIWGINGQLSFLGYYKNNLKDGEFQQFDSTGVSIHKGSYLEGKLISGEVIVQDIWYKVPEVPAKYTNGDETFENFLKRKSQQIALLKNLSYGKTIELLIDISKTGEITKLDTPGTISPLDFEILKVLFDPAPVFAPATVENIPVDSEMKLYLYFSEEGIRLISNRQDNVKSNIEGESGAYTNVEEMPEFPGGILAMRQFLAINVRYPVFAQVNGIQGKVYVTFVVQEDGSVSNINIAKGIHPVLDSEAIRVIKLMPNWTPGKQKGKPVKVSYTVPITFRIG
jgi:TonB family protein